MRHQTLYVSCPPIALADTVYGVKAWRVGLWLYAWGDTAQEAILNLFAKETGDDKKL